MISRSSSNSLLCGRGRRQAVGRACSRAGENSPSRCATLSGRLVSLRLGVRFAVLRGRLRCPLAEDLRGLTRPPRASRRFAPGRRGSLRAPLPRAAPLPYPPWASVRVAAVAQGGGPCRALRSLCRPFVTLALTLCYTVSAQGGLAARRRPPTHPLKRFT